MVRMILRFARSIGMESGSPDHRTFVFDNPGPSPGSPNYSHGIGLVIGPDVDAGDPVEIEEIPSAKCAATRRVGLENIGNCWRAHLAWFEDSSYSHPHTSGGASGSHCPLQATPRSGSSTSTGRSLNRGVIDPVA